MQRRAETCYSEIRIQAHILCVAFPKHADRCRIQTDVQLVSMPELVRYTWLNRSPGHAVE